jgi:hypothetical protein
MPGRVVEHDPPVALMWSREVSASASAMATIALRSVGIVSCSMA